MLEKLRMQMKIYHILCLTLSKARMIKGTLMQISKSL